MTQILKYFFKSGFVLCALSTTLHAQSVIWPSAIRAGVDLSRIGITLIDPERTQFEITADIDIYKYFLAFDYGYWKTDLTGPDFNYTMNGRYFRAGIDYNFLFSDEDNHVIFFGLRYCRSKFNEELNYQITDPYYGSGTSQFNEPGNTASWMEANTGIKIHVWKELYMGWTGRLKFGLNLNTPENFTSYEIPGFGITTKKTNWGLNYIISYRLAFRKKPRILPKPSPQK